MGWVWEIRRCKLAVVFFGSAVVGFGSIDLITKTAEKCQLVVDMDLSLPALLLVVPDDAFIF